MFKEKRIEKLLPTAVQCVSRVESTMLILHINHEKHSRFFLKMQ